MPQSKIQQPANSNEPQIFFILSTGRSGTKSISEFFSTFEGCECPHEPEPKLIFESSAFRYGHLSQDQIVQILLRLKPLNQSITAYGVSNQTLSLIIPALQQAFPTARYIWLARSGLDVVASAVARNWYTGLSVDGKSYDNCYPLEKRWIDGRLQGDQCGDVPEAEWKAMTPFDKCCWYWGYINKLIEEELRAFVDSSAFRMLRLEDFDSNAGPLADWFSLSHDNHLSIPHQHRAHYALYSPHLWTDAEWKSFERWCGSAMDRLYPSWRQAHQDHMQIATAESLIQAGQLDEAETLLNLTFNSRKLDARAHNALGVIHYSRGDVQKTKQYYEMAVSEDPENMCFLLNLADLVFVAENCAEAALELYLRVIQHDPLNVQCLMNMYVVCLKLGHSARAQEIINTLKEIMPGKPEVADWLRQMNAGGLYLPETETADHSPQTRESMPLSTSRSSIGQDLPVKGDHRLNFSDLLQKLTELGWASKYERYQKNLSCCRQLRTVADPKISIIVISWRRHPDTLKSFKILDQQRQHGFELIFVDNGSPEGSFRELENYIDTYVRLYTNTGAYLARNIGAVFAKAPILFFLEDDGIPMDNIVSSHLSAHKRYDVISVRGAYLPKTRNNSINSLAKHYYLGDRPFPWFVNLEGNASYSAEAFFAVGGWDDDNRFGHGGPELSRRLLRYAPDWCKQIYSPEPVIMHDYAGNHAHLVQKQKKQRSQMRRIEEREPGFKNFLKQWQQFYLRTDLLKERHRQPSSVNDTITVTQQPRFVSVVIPTHNRCSLLKQALESALRQTTDNYEVLVVDDGSADETEDLLRSFACGRLRYSKKSHTGAPDTRNFAIEKAHGEYILWLDDDDVLSPDAVATHLAVLAQHPEADVVYGVLQYFKGHTGQNIRLFDPKDWSMNNDMLLSTLVTGCCIPNPGTLVRRSCYERIGRYDTGFTRAHDYEFWARAAGQLKFKKNYTIVCRYRIHTTNMSTGNMVDRSFESRIIRRMVDHYGLRRIYHWFDWSNHEAAEGAALYMVAEDLFNLGDLYHSERLLGQIPINLWTVDIADLRLKCLLFQGRWKSHGDFLQQVKERKIIPPQGILSLRQKADQYWRLIHGLRQALNKKNLKKSISFLNSMEDKSFQLTPDCAAKLAGHLNDTTPPDDGSPNRQFLLRILREAVMADPTNQTLEQEIQKLSLSEIQQEFISAVRQRMLTTFNEPEIQHACGGKSQSPPFG